MNISGFLLLMILFGAMYTFPALTTAMASDFGTSRTILQGAFAIWGVIVAACGPLCGRLVDRRGVRPALVAGSIALALTMLGLGITQAPWQIYVVLLGLGAPAHALLQIGAIMAASRMGARRGGALGFAGAGMGAGLALLFPAAVWLSTIIGWRAVFFLLAALTVIVSVPSIAFTTASGALRPAPREQTSSWRRLLGSGPFVLLFVGGVGIGVADEALYQHLVPYLTTIGLPLTHAGTMMSLLSFGYIGGQIVGGWSSDRLGRWPVGLVAACLLGLAMLLFFATQPNGIALLLGALSAGSGLGATIAVRSATLADVFDGPSLGLVTGAYQWAYALGGGAVGWAGAYVYEHANSYAPVFAAGFLAMIIWAICLKATVHRRNDQEVAVVRAQDGQAELQANR